MYTLKYIKTIDMTITVQEMWHKQCLVKLNSFLCPYLRKLISRNAQT